MPQESRANLIRNLTNQGLVPTIVIDGITYATIVDDDGTSIVGLIENNYLVDLSANQEEDLTLRGYRVKKYLNTITFGGVRYRYAIPSNSDQNIRYIFRTSGTQLMLKKQLKRRGNRGIWAEDMFDNDALTDIISSGKFSPLMLDTQFLQIYEEINSANATRNNPPVTNSSVIETGNEETRTLIQIQTQHATNLRMLEEMKNETQYGPANEISAMCGNETNFTEDPFAFINEKQIIGIVIVLPDNEYTIECYTTLEIPELLTYKAYLRGVNENNVVYKLPYTGVYIDELSMKLLQMYRFFIRSNPVMKPVGHNQTQSVSYLRPISRENYVTKNWADTSKFIATAEDVQTDKYIGNEYVQILVNNVTKIDVRIIDLEEE